MTSEPTTSPKAEVALGTAAVDKSTMFASEDVEGEQDAADEDDRSGNGR